MIPGCSTCGLAVEWLRSCYSSEWFLFSDSPTTAVRGRYYFSPPGTPFFSQPNLLGSRVWNPYTVDDGTSPDPDVAAPALGESRSAAHRWDAGYLPVAMPSNVIIGNAACLADGALLADGVPLADQVEGFPPSCFLPPVPPNPDYLFAFAIWRCPVQFFWAQALYLLTWGYHADLGAWLAARFTGATIIIESKTVAFPPYAVVIHPDYCCGLLAGTQSMEQALVQALNLIQGPADVGGFSTGMLWYGFATQVLTLLKDNGVTDARPIMLTGHSYGGAAAMVAAARVHLGQPTREIRYLTFGAPKPGDARLAKLLQGEFNGLSLVNDGDLVGALPPSADVIASMADFLPIGAYVGWTQWVYPPESGLLFGNQLLKNRTQAIDSRLLFNFLVSVATTWNIAASLPHEIGTYVGAIALRCPQLVPTNVGQVLGMTAVSPAQPGQVLGFFPMENVNSACCDGMPWLIALRCIAATDSLSSYAGTLTALVYDQTLDAWFGWFPSKGAPNAIELVLICDNDIIGFFWTMGDIGSIYGGGTTPAGCPPFLMDTSWSAPLGSGEMVFCFSADGACPMPTGGIIAYAGSSPPLGYLPCDGSAVSRTTYSNLFAAIGTTFGAGDGSTTFNVPDLRDRAPIGISPGSLGTDRPSVRNIADVGGEESHVLIIAEQPSHTHSVTDPGHNHQPNITSTEFVTNRFIENVQSGTGATFAGGVEATTNTVPTGISLANTGGGGGHNNMEPFLAILWCIAY